MKETVHNNQIISKVRQTFTCNSFLFPVTAKRRPVAPPLSLQQKVISPFNTNLSIWFSTLMFLLLYREYELFFSHKITANAPVHIAPLIVSEQKLPSLFSVTFYLRTTSRQGLNYQQHTGFVIKTRYR